MSIKRKNKSSQITTIPCLYAKDSFINWRIPITAIASIEFKENNTVKFIFNTGTTVTKELSPESIKLLYKFFPNTILLK